MSRRSEESRQDRPTDASSTPMDSSEKSDEQLVRQASEGDQAAQQCLWNRHKRWVAAIVLAHRPRSIDVEDLMQEVAVKFIDKLDTLRDAEAFRPWLRQIVINACRGAARSLRPTLSLVDRERDDATGTGAADVGPPASDEESNEAQVDRRDAVDCVLRYVLTLPSEYREPLLLRCVRSLTYQQIGEILDLPVTTVETRLARARKMLREEVGPLAVMDQSG